MRPHLTNGGKPPATEDEALRMFLGSVDGRESSSEGTTLLSTILACDRFYKGDAKMNIQEQKLSDKCGRKMNTNIVQKAHAK